MISEKQLSEHFHSFWEKHFPLLTPSYVRRFNLERKDRLHAANGYVIPPLDRNPNVERFDLVAELAFELAAQGNTNPSFKVSSLEVAIERAIRRISLLENLREIPPPSEDEIAEALAVRENYTHFFETMIRGQTIHFRPLIKGAGILDQMEADFCTTDTLFEIKAVSRNLHSIDLRQVICYLVAGIGSHQYAWENYCIFNPRRAVFYTGNIPKLLGYLSGSTASECIDEVLDSLMNREQPLETIF
jgi:hypothetical protein